MSDDLVRSAEQMTLGAMMLGHDAVASVVDILASSADFHFPAHRVLYAHIAMAYDAGEPTEPTAVARRIDEAGHLKRVGGLEYLHTVYAAAPTVAEAPYYARMVADFAGRRRLGVLAERLSQAAELADAEQRDRAVETVRGELAGVPVAGVGRARVSPLDWPTFLQREMCAVDFLAGRLMARGEQVAVVGDGKAGKSLFVQEWLWRVSAGLPFLDDGARPPLRVLYVDQENTEDEIQERLVSFGATAETLTNLLYLSFPGFRPLNKPQGAADLLAAVDEFKPAVVAFDTISRMIAGKENDSDPWLDLYRLALLPLKARRVSSIRLDHFGKDATRGSRGNSAKTQDVDAAWELIPTERGSDLLRLTRTHTRTGKGPGEFLLRRHGELVGDRWKAGGTYHALADESEIPSRTPDEGHQYTPATRRVLGALEEAGGQAVTVRQIGDALAAQAAGPLTARTIQLALRTLADAGRADEIEVDRGRPSLWTGANP